MIFLLWLALSLDRGLPRHPVGERPAALFHGFAAAVCLLHVGLGVRPSLIHYVPGGHLVLGLTGLWYHFVGVGRHTVAAMRGER